MVDAGEYWRAQTKTIMDAQAATQWDVAHAIAEALNRPTFTQATVQSALSGRTRPPLDAIEAWADSLKLKGAKRDAWLALAISAHLSPTMAANVLRWQRSSERR